MRYLNIRSKKGSAQISEFAAALVLLVLCLFVPLLDLGIMPVRWFLSHEIISTYARKLSLCESLSQAYAVMDADPSLESRLVHLGGVEPKNITLGLAINRTSPPFEHIYVTEPKKIPKEWWPEGRKSPCEYILDVSVELEIAPAILFRGTTPAITGLNKPVPFIISQTAPWENLGRNPITKGYFINE
jgi:hypothetical protein